MQKMQVMFQFNFSTLEQLRAILLASKELNYPVILGTSEGESEYLGLKEIVTLTDMLKKEYKVRAYLNFDHGKDIKKIKNAINLGYDSVHFDGSSLPLNENINITKKIVALAHKKRVLVEGEIGKIKGESTFHRERAVVLKEDLALPEQAKEFVLKTGVDRLAVAIGNIHGIYEEKPAIDFERLEQISKAVNVPLVLHGASGIKNEDILKALTFGVKKININTELRMAWADSLKRSLENEVKPYIVLKNVQEDVKNKVKEKLSLLI